MISIRPIRRDSTPARATACPDFAAARGRTAAAIIGTREESGPTISTREGPKTA